ncbi:MAG: FKBP-type peptidyl-prolyl cis-trans isomerase [Ignavibacteria bacterium]|nr:FKBP-type peptidyl-prolyl cis-trans isomerase [Ignavibacteria bacterium]
MIIQKNKVGVLTYGIYVENESGELLEHASNEAPRTLLFGTGRLLKSFEERLLGLKSGDSFEFILSPEEAFGVVKQELLMEIPTAAFMVNGKIKEDTLVVGKTVPMMDNQGNPFDGKVVAINGEQVSMDFNHPLAGKNLFTKGSVLNVREATYDELNPAPSGCGCGTPNDSCCGGSESKGHNHHDVGQGCGVCGDFEESNHHHHHQHGGCGC